MSNISGLAMNLGRLLDFLGHLKGFAAIGAHELAGLNATDPKGEGEILAALDAAARQWRASGQGGQAGKVDQWARDYRSKARLREALTALDGCHKALEQAEPDLSKRLQLAVLGAWADPSGGLVELRAATTRVEQWTGLDDVLAPKVAELDAVRDAHDRKTAVDVVQIPVLDAEHQRKRLPKCPPKHYLQAWRLSIAMPGTQADLATMLSKELKHEVSQAQVSAWLKSVRAYLKAGGVLPELPVSGKEKTRPVDPAVIDLGRRQDRRAKRQRERFED